MLDRRQLLTGVVGLLGGLMAPHAGLAQAGVVALNDRLSLITLGRTNVLALSTPGGLVVVDTGAPDATAPLVAALQPLAGRPMTVFNTHFHTEHTGGNEALREAGATIIAHENTRLWMATPTWLPAEDRYRPPRPKSAHPTKTFYTQGAMQAAGERIEYGYLIEAHTSGDIYVF